ncbi:MAG: ABC transporter permease [Endomicrobia bacterium]|nr:ABC transporter permease [Endomicrobiia bacterium]
MKNLMYFLSSIYAYIYRNYIFAKRNLFTFFDILFWPVIGIISIGMMSNFLTLQKNLLSFLLTGAITSGVLQVVQLEVSYGILYEVWSKSTKQIFIAPTKYHHIIIGSWIVGIVRGIVVFAILVFLSKLLFGFYLPPLSNIFVSLVGIFLTSAIVGMMVNFFVILYGQRVDIIAWSFSVIAMLICGIYYPVNVLPQWLQIISQFIPLTYFLEHFRSGLGFEKTFKLGLEKAFFLCIIYILILSFLISLAFKHAKKTGLILKLSE